MAKKKNKSGQVQAPAVSIISLGCSKNLVDTEDLFSLLYQKMFFLTSEPEYSDIVIINTCGFIQSAIDESNEQIREILMLKDQGQIQSVYVMGCYASRAQDEIKASFPQVDGVYPLDKIVYMVKAMQEEYGFYEEQSQDALSGIRPISATLPHYSYLKISEGCNRTCTYCTIPSIRGANVDKTVDELYSEAASLVGRGVKEINIIAQDTTAYGIEKYGQPKLLELLQRLEKVEGLEWMRLLYAYPDHFNDGLIDLLLNSPKMLKYLDLPIQHASSSVLKRMNRTGSFALYDDIFDKLRGANEDFVLRTTVIIGFPGETDEEFQELYDYLEKRRFDRLGAFCYFDEKGTAASKMKNKVPTELAQERLDRLMTLQQNIHFEENEKWLGRDISFIVDEVGENGVVGRTWRDAVEIDPQIFVKTDAPLSPGMIATCRVTGSNEYDLEGVM
ncbi:MAG: 30S ribosomal protein S12 methylthiotransferase RimO [Planctomycetes bacterium]|nr:30S ribosomal protein S12 methylthiotransferase RimO [Planctomycetota bacterium]